MTETTLYTKAEMVAMGADAIRALELAETDPNFPVSRRALWQIASDDSKKLKRQESHTTFPSADAAEPEPITPLSHPDEADERDDLINKLREENERLLKELEQAKAEAPVPLPPNPAEARLADYGEVGDQAAERDLTPDHLVDAIRKDPIAAQEVIAKLSQDGRRRITELLNVEKAELRNKRNAGQADDADLARLEDVDRLINLFARVGEK